MCLAFVSSRWRAAAGALACSSLMIAAPGPARALTASIGDTSPAASSAGSGATVYARLEELVRALDRANGTNSTILVRPFARSLQETAAGRADFHIPFAQSPGAPAPPGLEYVLDVQIGEVVFVVYSRKDAPYDAASVAHAAAIEIEPGHESFFGFPVHVTFCVPCSLDKLLLGRIDALVVASSIVDPLLRENPKYRAIHRARYRAYPVRALVPTDFDSSRARRYLIDGVTRLRRSGELQRIMSDTPYSDWQP